MRFLLLDERSFVATVFLQNKKRKQKFFAVNRFVGFVVMLVDVGFYIFNRAGRNGERKRGYSRLELASSKFLKYLASLAVFGGIITTQFSTEYPLVCLLKQRKKSGLYIVLLALLTFVLSRLGFYVIVDVIYPLIALIVAIYYLIIVSKSLFSFRQARLRHTSKRQARLKVWSKS